MFVDTQPSAKLTYFVFLPFFPELNILSPSTASSNLNITKEKTFLDALSLKSMQTFDSIVVLAASMFVKKLLQPYLCYLIFFDLPNFYILKVLKINRKRHNK